MKKALSLLQYLTSRPRLVISLVAGFWAGFVAAKLLLNSKILTITFLATSLTLSIIYFGLIYHYVFGLALEKLREYSLRTRLVWIGTCMICGLSMIFAIPFNLPKHLEIAPLYQRLLIWTAVPLFFSGVLLVLSIWLVSRPANPKTQSQVYWWTWIPYSSIMIFCWIFYLLAYYPGIMSPDSLNQWGQMISGKYSDWHPIFHTLTNWLITRIWFSPAAIAIGQIISLGIVMGWGFSILQRIGVNRWLLYGLVVFSGLTPGNGMMVITLWKDIPFSVVVLALTLIVLEIVNTRGKWLERPDRYLFLGLIFAFVLLYRHNGYLVVPFIAFLLLVFYQSKWKQLLSASLFCIALFWGVRYPLYRSLTVTDYRVPSTIAALNIIAAHFDNNTPMTQNERFFLNNILPLQPQETAWPYNCYSNDELFLRNRLRFDFILDHQAEIWLLAGKLSINSPRPTLTYLACNSTFLFRISRPINTPYEFGVNIIYSNEFGLAMKPIFPSLKEAIDVVLIQDSLIWILGRAAFWFYASIFSVWIFALRYKSPLYFIVLMPSLLSSIPMALLGGGQIFRYVYPSYLAGIILFGLLFVEKPMNKQGVPGQ